MRLTLVISTLSSGGAERVLVRLSEGFLQQGHHVSVITFSHPETDFYQLPDRAERLALNLIKVSPSSIHGLWNNLNRIPRLRQGIISTRPDVVISFMDTVNVMTTLALANTKYPVLVTEHNDPAHNYCGKIWEQLRYWVYPRAAKVVSVSQGVDSYFNWLPKDKRTVVYNPIVLGERTKICSELPTLPSEVDLEKKWLVAMGRLTEQKGFDLLLSAFKSIADNHSDWQLLILGQGQLRAELEALRDNLGLAGQVIFTGAIANPFPVLQRAKIFVMASRHEGFPMAHCEAMACGLPVIATDCPSGPREIVRHEIDGLLVPNENVSAIAAAMERLMSDERERQDLARRSPEIIERFGLEKILHMWSELFKEVTDKEVTDKEVTDKEVTNKEVTEAK